MKTILRIREINFTFYTYAAISFSKNRFDNYFPFGRDRLHLCFDAIRSIYSARL